MRAWFAIFVAVFAISNPARALVIESPFAGAYNALEIGEPPGGIGDLGGLAFVPGDPHTLLVGGRAAGPLAAVYAVGVARDAAGHIVGYSGPPVLRSSAAGVTGGIDGGLAFGPGGVLFYTTYRDNQLGQIEPGSTAPDRLIDLTTLGVLRSTGSLQFVPPGFGGAGRLKILSFTRGLWYDATVAADGAGTFDVALSGVELFIGGGPEGVVYVGAGNPGFDRDAILVSEWSNGRVVSYDIDANGDPILETQRIFISALSNAQGAAIDPLTGDFLFSKYAGDDRGVVVVGGFAPPSAVPVPAALWLLLAPIGALAAARRRP
ncbi:MAG: VPLPA-CTERM sorting domain-containing protein [Gammaproteobacteria bacterium]